MTFIVWYLFFSIESAKHMQTLGLLKTLTLENMKLETYISAILVPVAALLQRMIIVVA